MFDGSGFGRLHDQREIVSELYSRFTAIIHERLGNELHFVIV